MPNVVKVACRVPNGLMIRLYKRGFDDGTGDGVRPIIHDGVAVRLNGPSSIQTGAGATDRQDLPPGLTDVDAEWMAAWLAQNAASEFVSQGQVYVVEDEANPTPP